VRSVCYRFSDPRQFEQQITSVGDCELELDLPPEEVAEDGEWVLAIFDVGVRRKAISAAARAIVDPDGARLVFEPRDYHRLADFAAGVIEGDRASFLPPEPTTSTPDDEIETPRPTSWPPREGRGARILVVDDDPDIRAVVAAMLAAVGLIVTTKESAEDALAAVEQEPFDLLVFDWNLPKMSGIELCRTIRRDKHITLPVLFLTANASSQDMVDAFASGADDYMVKPFHAPELGARIFSLLRRTRA
jgi:two-component system, OmpR family, phosphate regulon response regulator PhoB